MRTIYAILSVLLLAVIITFVMTDPPFWSQKTERTDQSTELNPKKLKVLFWGSPIDNPAMEFFQRACQDFEQENASLEIEIDFYSVEQYKKKLPILMAANQAPDIFMTWCGAFLEQFVASGRVMPLDDLIASAPSWRASFPDNAFDLLTYNGKTYGVPTSKVVAVLFYNRQIFEQFSLAPPTTQNELMSAIEIFRSNQITPMAFGNKEPWVGGMLAGQLIQRLGGRHLLQDINAGRHPWTHAAVIKAADVIQQLVSLGAFPERPNMIDYQSTIDMFQDGQAAMMLMGSWYIQYFLERSDASTFQLGMAPFPALAGGVGSVDEWMGQTDMNLAISAQCKDKQTAFELVQWITSALYQKHLIMKAGLLPATNVQVDAASLPKETLALQQRLQDMRSLFIFPDIGLGGVAGQEFNLSIQKLFAGHKSIETFEQLQTKLSHLEEP